MTTQPKTEILPTFPPLETERLHLRLISLDDTDFIHRHFSDPRVTQYLMDAPPVVDVAEARDIIRFFLEPEGKTRCRWVLARKADQRVIGTCGFHRWEKDYHRAEIGYDLSPEFWGQGYMREALRAVIPHGFARMDLNRVDALIYVGNPQSFGLAEKLGFRREGLLRDYFYLNGAYYDHYLYGLLRKDWVG